MPHEVKQLKHIIPVIIIITLLSGCERYFDEQRNTIQTITSEADIEASLTGAYHALLNTFDAKGYMLQTIKGDDINLPIKGHNRLLDTIDTMPVEHRYSFSSISRSRYDNEDIHRHLWTNFYTSIVMANNVIVQINDPDEQPDIVRYLLGEAYFLRGICYYRLTRLFGRIPLVKDVDVDYSLSKATFKEIYTLITEDLSHAAKYLPVNKDSSRIPYVTPNSGAAKALLAEVYLTMGGYPLHDVQNYTKAADMAGKVIDSASIFGFELIPDFALLWDDNAAGRKESIFHLAYTSMNEWFSMDLRPLGHRYRLFYGLSPIFSFAFRTPFLPEYKFYNNFPASYRKNITFNTSQLIGYTVTREQVIEPIYTHLNEVPPLYKGIYFKKMPYLDIIAVNIDSTPPEFSDALGYDIVGYRLNATTVSKASEKFYLLRYAHTLLTYAEAKARSGQLDASAYEAVNMVRRRANKVDIHSPSQYDLPSGLTEQQFIDSVIWERAWEFAGEPEGRWFDLLRLGKVEELPDLRFEEEGGPPDYPITKEDYYWPIPKEDMHLNPNLE